MEFKIDTKDTFSTIMPVIDRISANLTDELRQKCAEMRQSGSGNIIIDLQHCIDIDADVIAELVQLHEESYAEERSLVYTGITAKVLTALKKDETDLLINLAPRMDEAIDIISMEILERDLFGEE
jgi:anti-anti-sigma regulatory factor